MPEHDAHLHTPAGRPRARALGIPLPGTRGPANAITDVPGVEVGFATLIEGEDVRTGVTAVHPRGRADPGTPCAAGTFALNGNGEMTGVAWIAESGTTALPITLTHTHAVGTAHDATIRWVAERRPDLGALWMLPVATETWDGYLNDLNGGHVDQAVVLAALDAARPGPVEEGSVGGGTGMNLYEFKGGTGTASRVVPYGPDRFTVAVLLQGNFGARSELVIGGVPLGRELAEDNPLAEWGAAAGAGSVVAVVATDAPLLPGQCAALARRVPLGLARTGTAGSHFSGDLFLALSTANPAAFSTGFPEPEPRGEYGELRFVPWRFTDPLFEAVVQCVEEAVLNALVANEEMVGRAGHRSPALPRDRVVALLRARGVLG